MDGGGDYPIHGASLAKDGWHKDSWTSNGLSVKDCVSAFDIIEEWVQKPVVDWSVMPAWANYIAMEKSGDWYWFNILPRFSKICWLNGGDCGEIPEQYAPKFEGDWKDSLVARK